MAVQRTVIPVCHISWLTHWNENIAGKVAFNDYLFRYREDNVA